MLGHAFRGDPMTFADRNTIGNRAPHVPPLALDPPGPGAGAGARLVAMTALISHLSFDSVDACSSAAFWGKVLAFVEDPDDPNQPGDEECMITSADGTERLLFIEVPDGKLVKNRVHLDLKPAPPATRELELKRLLALGAREVADRRRPDGSGWVVLADPEGNEFCILRSDAERSAAP